MTDEAQSSPLKVAIVGKAPSSFADAPYGDDSWEVWTLSNNAQLGEAKRWSRHFEIHPLKNFSDDPSRSDYWKWLRSEPEGARPIYTQGQATAVPASVAFPIEACVERFGSYFNNTVSYLIAFAIMEDAKEIGIYGVDMAVGGHDPNAEYSHQRPSCEYMIGLARGLGIKVYVPAKSDLLKVRQLYGFQPESAMMQKLRQRRKEVQAQKQKAENEMEAAKQQVCSLNGVLDDMRYFDQWMP